MSHPANNPREISGWMLYDWANSAFATTVITVLAGPYLTALAQAAVSENGVVLSLGPFAVTAKSFFPYCISASVFLQVLLLPFRVNPCHQFGHSQGCIKWRGGFEDDSYPCSAFIESRDAVRVRFELPAVTHILFAIDRKSTRLNSSHRT